MEEKKPGEVDAPQDDEFVGKITEAEKSNLKLEVTEPAAAYVSEEEDMARARALFEKSSGIDIKVHNPQERKGGAFAANFYTYDILGNDKHGKVNVSRRYKEFDALRIKLKENWPGIFIPSIPDKTVKNKGDHVIQERTLFLDHFMKKCAKMDHIYYSEEMQLFLRSTGSSEEIIRNLTALPPKTCVTLYNQYKALFPDFDLKIEKKTQEDVVKRVNDLKVPLREVIEMRESLKAMKEIQPDLKHYKTEFMKSLGQEAITKIKDKSEQEAKSTKVKEYMALEKEDSITKLSSNLKILRRDLESFFLITGDVSFVFKIIGHNQHVIQESGKELQVLRSSDKEQISDGLFKKVNRQDKIKELEKVKETAEEELRAAQKLHDMIYILLEKQEIPLILYVKNMGLANGIMELTRRRKQCLALEQEVMDIVVSQFPQA